MLKKLLALFLVLCLFLTVSLAEEEAETEEGPSWVITDSTEIPGEVLALFDAAVAEEEGVTYEPEALLGVGDGVYCLLCRVRYEDLEAAPEYDLVYVSEAGLQNTWELWVEDHAEPSQDGEDEQAVTYSNLTHDLLQAWTAKRSITRDVQALGNTAAEIAEAWDALYMTDPPADLRVSDPADLAVSGSHAIVVLGLELADGEMQDELKGRCDAAAEVARAWPDAVLICSGGATGENNPDGHTEAGMMKAYLSEKCGIDPDRILVDERALSTVGNAVNSFVILRELGIGSFSLVTSGYHLCRAQILYQTLNLCCRELLGYACDFSGAYGFEIEAPEGTEDADAVVASYQLEAILTILGASEEQARGILMYGGEI